MRIVITGVYACRHFPLNPSTAKNSKVRYILDVFLLDYNQTKVYARQSFELLLNGVPYFVKAQPFEFNAETRFKVSYNESDEHIFTWDTDMGRLSAIDEDSYFYSR